jgi:hypothetical protein
MRKTDSAWIGKDLSLGKPNPEKETFTKLVIKAKRNIPGVGIYSPNFESVFKPYMKKRV